VHEEVPKAEAAVETFGALKEWYRDRHLAVRCRSQPNKRTQGKGRSQKKLATASRGMTCRAIPALHKGHGHQGLGKRNVVQGSQKGWTFRKRHRAQPECNNGIRNQDLKVKLHLGSKGNVNETFRKTLGLEITNRIARSSVRIRNISVRTLWKGQPPLK
jgi:hypothetical protein